MHSISFDLMEFSSISSISMFKKRLQIEEDIPSYAPRVVVGYV